MNREDKLGYCAGPEHDFTPRWKTADGKLRCYWCGIVEGADEEVY